MRYSRDEGWSSTPWLKWVIIGLFILLVLAVLPRIGVWGWILFFMFGVPILKKLAAVVTQSLDDYSSRQRPERAYRAPSAERPDDEYAGEDEYADKPKRRPEYTVGDDGELVELETVLDQEKSKHGGSDSRLG